MGQDRDSLRVLHLADAWEGGGAEGVFRETVAASREFASAVDVVTSNGRGGALSYVFSFKEARQLSKRLRAFAPDVVHVQNYYHALSPSVLWALKRYRRRSDRSMRVVHTAHDYHLVCPNSGMQHFPRGVRTNVDISEVPVKLLRRYDHRSLVHAFLKIAQHTLAYRVMRLQRVFDDVIAPSEFMRNALRGRGLRAKEHLVRNPVATDFLRRERAQPKTERVAGASLKLAVIARLVPEKGIAELFSALRVVAPRLSLEVHLFGDGEQAEELDALARRWGIRAVFHGHLPHDDLWHQMAGLDVLVVPSIWYENAPLVIIEAGTLGLPVMGNSLGGVAEMVAETSHGVACDTTDPVQIETALRSLRRSLGENTVVEPERYSAERYVADLEAIYRRPNVNGEFE